MTTMVKCVAQAIKAQMIGTAHDAFYEKVARAAITAMREPTEEMLAACNGLMEWQMMIDAALEKKP
jgi:hypothetical protein